MNLEIFVFSFEVKYQFFESSERNGSFYFCIEIEEHLLRLVRYQMSKQLKERSQISVNPTMVFSATLYQVAHSDTYDKNNLNSPSEYSTQEKLSFCTFSPSF